LFLGFSISLREIDIVCRRNDESVAQYLNISPNLSCGGWGYRCFIIFDVMSRRSPFLVCLAFTVLWVVVFISGLDFESPVVGFLSVVLLDG